MKRVLRAVRRVRAGAVRKLSGSIVVDLRGVETAQYRTRRELTPAEADSVVDRFRAGETMNAIASDLEVDRRRVRKVLYERGVASTPRRLSEAEIDLAVRLYQGGDSLAVVGDRLGVYRNTIKRRLVERAVKAPWIRSTTGGRGLLRPDSDSGLDLGLDLAVDIHIHCWSNPERQSDSEVHLLASKSAGLLKALDSHNHVRPLPRAEGAAQFPRLVLHGCGTAGRSVRGKTARSLQSRDRACWLDEG